MPDRRGRGDVMRGGVQKPRKAGFTLVEVLVAGAILALLTCAALEGVIVAVRISHENAQHLAAEALAFDLAWLHFNRDYEDLRRSALSTGSKTITYANAAGLAPTLAAVAPTARVQLSSVNGEVSGVLIHSEVAWGANDNRRTVSHDVFRGSMARVPGG